MDLKKLRNVFVFTDRLVKNVLKVNLFVNFFFKLPFQLNTMNHNQTQCIIVYNTVIDSVYNYRIF